MMTIKIHPTLGPLFGVALFAIFSHGCGNTVDDSTQACPIMVDSFTPTSGHVGDMVTITGQNLGGTDAKVGLKGFEANGLPGSNDTTLMIQVPLGAETAPFTVDVPSRQNCEGTSADSFTVLP
jgi:hypothetical protein